MATDFFDKSLSPLLSKAAQLNQVSDRANRHIGDVEKKLSDAKIGITFWFDGPPLAQSDAKGDLGPDDFSEDTADILGYAKIDGKWCLAVKRMRFVRGFYEGDMSRRFRNVFVDGDPSPLLNASRELRLAALRILPDFLAAFTARIDETVGEIEAATGELFL